MTSASSASNGNISIIRVRNVSEIPPVYGISSLLGKGAYGSVYRIETRGGSSSSGNTSSSTTPLSLLALKETKCGVALGGLPDMTRERLLFEVECLSLIPSHLSPFCPRLKYATVYDIKEPTSKGTLVRLAMSLLPGEPLQGIQNLLNTSPTNLKDAQDTKDNGTANNFNKLNFNKLKEACQMVYQLSLVFECGSQFCVHRDVNLRNVLRYNGSECDDNGNYDPYESFLREYGDVGATMVGELARKVRKMESQGCVEEDQEDQPKQGEMRGTYRLSANNRT